MKKNGFTLIELIVTIGLLCLLGTVIVTNLSSNLSNQQDSTYREFKRTLEDAACVFIDMNVGSAIRNTCKTTGTCKVSMKNLLENGYIEENNLINPRNEQMISLDFSITITYPGGIKTCTYIE